MLLVYFFPMWSPRVFLIGPHFIPYPLPKVLPFFTYVVEPKANTLLVCFLVNLGSYLSKYILKTCKGHLVHRTKFPPFFFSYFSLYFYRNKNWKKGLYHFFFQRKNKKEKTSLAQVTPFACWTKVLPPNSPNLTYLLPLATLGLMWSSTHQCTIHWKCVMTTRLWWWTTTKVCSSTSELPRFHHGNLSCEPRVTSPSH
jgi:hypothetical protein